jgi:hypothetical protein
VSLSRSDVTQYFKGEFAALDVYDRHPAHPLASSWAKYNRAAEHYRDLTAVARELLSLSSEQGTLKLVPAGQGVAELVSIVPPVPLWVSCLVGDVAHCLRTALDHAAWSLAQRNRWLGNANEIQFPFVATATEFQRKLEALLRRYGRDAVTLLEQLQPYRDGQSGLLWLQDIDNADKHQSVVLTRHRLQIRSMSMVGPDGCERPLEWSAGEQEAPAVDAEPGRPIAQLRYDQGFTRHAISFRAQLQGTLTLQAETGRCWPAGRVDLVLRECLHVVEGMLLRVERFIEENRLT